MRQTRLYAVVLNVPAAVRFCIEADSEAEACTRALEEFLNTPRLFKRQELGNPTILSCDPLTTSEDHA
jgi:hypothetical protein